MAIITEEQEPEPKRQQEEEPAKKPLNRIQKPPSPSNPFSFWFYFTLSVSLFTLLFLSLPSLYPEDPKSWFLSLPAPLRLHYSSGRTIKAQLQTLPNHPSVELFTLEKTPSGSKEAEIVVLVHGLGLSSYSFRQIVPSLVSKGLRVIAIDLPGHGFSDKSVTVVEEGPNGVSGRVWDVYDEIKEKGLFWAFDRIVETGQIPYEEIGNRVSQRKTVKVLDLGPQEMGKVIGQVIETMGLAPVHLVLQDSALQMGGANWVLENSESVRSVTLVDTGVRGAFPMCILEVPVVREVVLGFSFLYSKLISLCCSKSIGGLDLEVHRLLLRGRDGKKAVMGIGKKMNYSFDIAEWGGSKEVKGVPMQVIWSIGWSKEWNEEGQRVAKALTHANFVTHSGGRWPQEDAADELAENIVKFVFSLPKTVRQVEEEPVPEHIQKMFDEAKNSEHHHHHGHGGHDHHDGHAHSHGADYMDPYGLGRGWGS